MLTQLPESARRPSRNRLGVASSAALHATLIAAAVVATARTGNSHPRVTPPGPQVFWAHPQPQTPHLPTTTGSPGHAGAGITVPIISLPSGPDIPTPGPTTIVPGLDTAWTSGVTGRATRGPAGPALGTGSPFTGDAVDEPVSVAGTPSVPRYPATLRDAGVDAHLTMTFVVDTTGRVERPSIHPLAADVDGSVRDAFAAAITDALLHTHFHPALLAGHRVRQLVQQEFVFAIQH